MIFFWFALVAFWIGVLFAFSILGFRKSGIFVLVWTGGLGLSHYMHIHFTIFMVFQTILTIILFLMLKYEWS